MIRELLTFASPRNGINSSIYMFFFLCSNALVRVEMKNEGEDAFKPEIYGDVLIIERRISESSSSTVLKDHQG